jgi:hypothetical protein
MEPSPNSASYIKKKAAVSSGFFTSAHKLGIHGLSLSLPAVTFDKTGAKTLRPYNFSCTAQ